MSDSHDTPHDAPLRSTEQLLDESPAGVWIIAGDGRTLYANESMVRLLGTSPSELLKTRMRQFIHPADLAVADEVLRADRPPIETSSLRLRRTDGSEVRVVIAGATWGGALRRGTVLAVSPTTATMQVAERLRHRERQFREAERLGHLGSWEWNVQTGKLTFSDELYRIFGIEPSVVEPTLESVVERTDPGDRDYFIGVVEEIAAGARERSFERRIHRPDGEVRSLRSNSRVIETDDAGRPVRVVGVCRDVTTERRALERGRRFQELYEGERLVAERLRQLDELRFAFMASVSNDLRSPLATVLGSATTLRDLGSTLDEATARSLLDQTIEQAQRLDALLADLLDLEQLRRGAVDGVFQPVALCDLVRSTIQGIGGAAARVMLTTPEPDVVVELDPPKARRIVENLIRNALRAGPPDTPVRVSVETTNGIARIQVDDEGPRVAEDVRATMFDPFASQSSGEMSTRSGLSLAIVGRYVRLHSGRAMVEDLDGYGSRVVVELPRHQTSTPSAPPATPSGDASVGPSIGTGRAMRDDFEGGDA